MTPDVRHQHLVVRAEVQNPPRPLPVEVKTGSLVERFARYLACRRMARWMRMLINRIDMKIMFGPKAQYCVVPGNRGMTAFAIIETSHIALHSWDECEPAILQLDVYTCSDLVIEDVIASLDIFEPTKIEYKFLDREHNLTLLQESGE